ncbi:hypothetical protein TNCV_4229671 [Trichonephila clavipes]|nr:hypothetical protein TNCV_4229671 [Trichonephila clavipes]
MVKWRGRHLSWHPLLTTTPHPREDVSALDRFKVHRCPTRRVLSGTGPEDFGRTRLTKHRIDTESILLLSSTPDDYHSLNRKKSKNSLRT